MRDPLEGREVGMSIECVNIITRTDDGMKIIEIVYRMASQTMYRYRENETFNMVGDADHPNPLFSGESRVPIAKEDWEHYTLKCGFPFFVTGNPITT